MGKSMLKPLKTKADTIIEALGDKVTTDFETNKKRIKELKLPLTKTNINKIAGYMVRTKKKHKKN